MRLHPDGESEVVSQALFGETVTVSQNGEGWLYITTPDEYSGWVRQDGVLLHQYTASHQVNRVSVPFYAEKGIRKGPVLTLPFGVGVQVVDSDSDWTQVVLPSGKICFTQNSHLSLPQILVRKELESFCQQFLGLPYIWGGRSSFGYDCSGFVQMLYGQMGIVLPRDSCEQAKALQEQTFENLTVGDLIFWGASAEKIGHVGCFLGQGRFIHATSREQKPWLRISHLSERMWSGVEETVYPHRCFRMHKKVHTFNTKRQ